MPIFILFLIFFKYCGYFKKIILWVQHYEKRHVGLKIYFPIKSAAGH